VVPLPIFGVFISDLANFQIAYHGFFCSNLATSEHGNLKSSVLAIAIHEQKVAV